ncbi:unnamed protein product [Trichobilharzia regenti]|nr:unnamed protein product [Trichobilharzia regenti]
MPEPLNAHGDFKGQKMAERLMNIIMFVFLVIAFPVGYYKQQMSVSVFLVLIGCLVTAVVVLPPWPCYHKNPVRWCQESQKNSKKTE